MKTGYGFKGLIIGVMIVTAGCGANPGKTYDVALQLSSFTAADYKHPFLNMFVPKAHASIASLKFCFKRLRFKMDDVDTLAPETSEDNIDFDLGEVDISAGATSLGTISLPEGTYRRIEFDLEPSCVSGQSIQIQNSNGSYSTSDRVTIKFSGAFTANSDGVLNLGVQTIIDQLNAYNGVGQLKDVAEAVSGELSE